MARSDASWGIDIGNSSLKAIRCRPDNDEPSQVVADAFDYIEYPKILTQPDADPGKLIAEAIQQFLSRNSVRGDRVAISVSGQNGLTRFIKLPPVEAKKIPDIVNYEARQQIPFELDDVVWDYQRMGGGSEEGEFALETKIGLFAMKRDQVFRALEPFRVASIEVDVVQLTPLALYNYLAFDRLYDLPSIDEYDPDNPPPSTAILSMGTDATDLVVTDGYRVWQRSIPLGGNHFTKALTKDLKLTFAKAEHLKRNATAAQDPKAVFQSMRPVFSGLLAEIQRSIGYFMNIERNAQINQMVTLGNALKLPGLRRYLAQSLGYEVVRIDSFRGLTGNEVVNAPAFTENLLCYGVSYGLALQGLGKSSLWTNLLPKELVKDRLIREKKPWAVAAAAMLLTGLAVSYSGYSLALGTVDNQSFNDAENAGNAVITLSKGFQDEASTLEESFNQFKVVGENLVGNVEGRIMWLELFKAINQCMPSEPVVVTPRGEQPKPPKEIWDREELHLDSFECQKWDSVDKWLAVMQQNNWYKPPEEEETKEESEASGESESDADAKAETASTETPEDGETPQTWLIQITGHHFHNRETASQDQGPDYVKQTLIHNLETKEIPLPVGDADAGGERKQELVSMKDLGIRYPSLVNPGDLVQDKIFPPGADPAEGLGRISTFGMGDGGARRNQEAKKPIEVGRFDFVVQFLWTPTPPSVRHSKKDAETETETETEMENENTSTES